MLFGLAQQMQAYKMLNDPEVGGRLKVNELFNLCKEAGHSEKAAQQAAKQRANALLDAKQPMFQTQYVHQ